MKRLIGTLIVLVAVCVTTSVASAGPPRHYGAHGAPHHRPTPHSAHRYGGSHFDDGYGHHPHHGHHHAPAVTGYRGIPQRPFPQPGYCPPGPSSRGFNYSGRNFGFSFGY